MKAITREVLGVLQAHTRVTAAGVAKHLAPDYGILAPTEHEISQSLEMLVGLGYAERHPASHSGPEYTPRPR